MFTWLSVWINWMTQRLPDWRGSCVFFFWGGGSEGWKCLCSVRPHGRRRTPGALMWIRRTEFPREKLSSLSDTQIQQKQWQWRQRAELQFFKGSHLPGDACRMTHFHLYFGQCPFIRPRQAGWQSATEQFLYRLSANVNILVFCFNLKKNKKTNPTHINKLDRHKGTICLKLKLHHFSGGCDVYTQSYSILFYSTYSVWRCWMPFEPHRSPNEQRSSCQLMSMQAIAG